MICIIEGERRLFYQPFSIAAREKAPDQLNGFSYLQLYFQFPNVAMNTAFTRSNVIQYET